MKRNAIGGDSVERGFGLLFALFLVALVIIGASVVTLSILTQGRREKETVMIWRGEQYERAIGLYYRKFGHFPTSIDQLVKSTNGIRFLREDYKDPMNKPDGSWRLIYVTPAGQLIGSVRYITLQEMAMADRARIMGIQMGQGAATGNGLGNPFPAPFGSQDQSQNPTPTPPGAPPAGGTTGSPPGGQSPDQSGQAAPPQPAPPQPAPFGVMQQSQPSGGIFQNNESTGQVIGGFIVGVASKIDRPSLKVYKGGTTYKQWEFIYNPLEQVQTFGGGGTIGGKPTGFPSIGMPTPQPPQPQIPH